MLKSSAVGVGCGVAATLFWLLALAGTAAVGLPLTTRTGGPGKVSMGLSEAVLVVGIFGFASGFGWMFRRLMRVARPGSGQ